ncbi:AP-5 complex subunit zeta-1 isoform X1 [Periophthalmus magnuspinnatus]|uniref:AP-5 complex subunit zeta-1 isoform X1 n=1 Tax=Periophthalmus magnuspinnatus TaxID=409849 RepID=UPI00145B17C7|nr:AP-5 complex subunit zeta-1 isoform X1 [Periophthalmus magnuspinnatus]
MYSHGSESLIKQARDIQESELQKFYSRLLKLLQGKDLGHEAVDSLQRLHLILSATKFTRKLPLELHKKIFSLISSPSEQFQILGSSVLRETLPLSDQDVNYIQNNPSVLNSHVTGLLLAHASYTTVLTLFCAQLVRSLESRHSEALSHSQTYTLPILNSILTHRPECLTEEQVTILSKKLVDWLRYASITQAASPGGFFSGSRSRQPCPIAELDGTVSGDFFTVLCVGQGFTEDQWMNVHSFSILRNWLLTYHSVSNCNSASDAAAARLQYSLSLSHSHSLSNDDRSVDGSVISIVSATSSSSRVLPPKERLREKSFQYCQRLIEQSDRKAQKKADSDLQKACLVEAVCILDTLCLEDCSLVYRAFPCIKALYGRLSSDLSHARVLLPVAQFYLNHGEMAAVDCECMWQLVFSRFPAELFNDPLLAHEFLRFVRQNIQNLPVKVPQYTRSFPNLLKFLAWDSPAMIDDFVDLLPSVVTTGTALELLHTLLDLPCLSATLVLQQRSVLFPITEPNTRCIKALDAFRNPTFRGFFLFLLRNEAGSGDTIDRLSVLHELLIESADWPRVVQCAQTVPVLLHIFFNTVLKVADEKLLAQLILVQLERSSLLLKVPNYMNEIHRVFSYHLLKLCKLHPSLVVDQSHELLDFAGTTSNVYNKEELYTHVVWVLGEYLSLSCDSRCSVRHITSCFEALEAVLFEITSSAPPPGGMCPNPRVITTLMSALAKLASRSHDLIPRVSLFLSKLRTVSRSGSVAWCSDDDDLVAIVTRGEELWSLLKTPGVAQSVLTPPPHVTKPQWHKDSNVAMPLRLQTLTSLMQPQ